MKVGKSGGADGTCDLVPRSLPSLGNHHKKGGGAS